MALKEAVHTMACNTASYLFLPWGVHVVLGQQRLVMCLRKSFINGWSHRMRQVLVEVLVQDVVVITDEGLNVVKPCSRTRQQALGAVLC